MQSPRGSAQGQTENIALNSEKHRDRTYLPLLSSSVSLGNSLTSWYLDVLHVNGLDSPLTKVFYYDYEMIKKTCFRDCRTQNKVKNL